MNFRFIFPLLFIQLLYAKDISFVNDIKPILDKRCVVCHSCYNSPCQVKLSSFEGIERGGTKDEIYGNRITAMDPTRLFIDATTEYGWRQKGFYSILDDLDGNNNSLMSILLDQKQKYPISKGEYAPETDTLACSKDLKEINKYLDDKPYHGMPYGMPALPKSEHEVLIKWIKDGAKDDTKVDFREPKEIALFEEFLNNSDIKHQVSARYIYEHLFLAHIKFPSSDNFYELVRSYDKQGKYAVPTRLPYDAINDKFYYSFRKITSTIVHKTHMVYHLDEKKLQRYKELFIEPKWNDEPYLISYDSKIAANPLTAYEQIPAKSRYRFLLDDVHYYIMTFIRGPVCKGQIALNVINDHFWLSFKNPDHDLTLDNGFIKANQKNLSLPNEYGANTPLTKTFDYYKYDGDTIDYYKNKNSLYENSGLKLDLKSIWRGNKPAHVDNDAILTVYRHFDSASVHKGAFGDTPRTMWVIDYPLLERLYYSLVAGFDVFGNLQHKLLVRKYMDRLRIEGESNFLEYLPISSRQEVFNSWYKGTLAKYLVTYTPSKNPTALDFQSDDHKYEMVDKILSYTNTKKDRLNHISNGHKQMRILENYNTKEELEKSLKDLTLFESIKTFKEFSSHSFNLAYIRFKINDRYYVYSLVVNRWHDSVAFMFNEDERLDTSKDTVNLIEGFIGSYPNYFVTVEQDDIPKFFKILKDYKSDESQLAKYFILRSDDNFWQTYDWFQERFNKDQPIDAGLFDLNRYYEKTFN